MCESPISMGILCTKVQVFSIILPNVMGQMKALRQEFLLILRPAPDVFKVNFVKLIGYCLHGWFLPLCHHSQ